MGGKIGCDDTKRKRIYNRLTLFLIDIEATVYLCGQQIYENIGQQGDGGCSAETKKVGVVVGKQQNKNASINKEAE